MQIVIKCAHPLMCFDIHFWQSFKHKPCPCFPDLTKYAKIPDFYIRFQNIFSHILRSKRDFDLTISPVIHFQFTFKNVLRILDIYHCYRDLWNKCMYNFSTKYCSFYKLYILKCYNAHSSFILGRCHQCAGWPTCHKHLHVGTPR